ncbi:MAG: arginase family protein, partial [Thermomicrobium sp.]|nr:arginase family protein [Thermomicrobium sp.]
MREQSDRSRCEAEFHPVDPGRPTVFGVPRASELPRPPHIAIVGIPFSVPYVGMGPELPSAAAPAAIRAASLAVQPYYRNWDVDFLGDLFNGRPVLLADAGDVRLVPGDHPGNLQRITAAIACLLRQGTIPIVLGGDHAVTIPVLRAYTGQRSLCIVQIDAHVDWRDEVDGIREGYSSPMRRASEVPAIRAMVQIGLRGAGSGRAEEFAAARAWGSILIPARTVHERGAAWVLAQLPAADGYYI